jgi:anti-anti-sigma factor
MSHNIVTFREDNGTLICEFKGKLDSVVSELVEDVVFDKIQQTGLPVAFDLKNAEYVSSAFLRLSIKAARASVGMTVNILNAKPDIQDIYKMTGLTKIFKFI